MRIMFLSPFLLAALSGVLLSLIHPPFGVWPLAGLALVPLFLSLAFAPTLKSALIRAYLCGLVFFAMSFHWFIHVTVVGTVFLLAFLALYFSLFGAMFRASLRLPTAGRIFAAAVFWVFTEWLRGFGPFAFGWGLLGHSLYAQPLLIQSADLWGVGGLSFGIAAFNALVYEGLRHRRGKGMGWLICVGVTFFAVLGTLFYSQRRLAEFTGRDGGSVRVGVVQANIEQDRKWDPAEVPHIFAKYLAMTENLIRDKPDVIIWPESALPVQIGDDVYYIARLREFVREAGIPLLFGSVVHEEEDVYYNAALLLDGQGRDVERYEKIHLVPFGEYLPVRGIMGRAARWVPLEDFTAGREMTVFEIPGTEARFSVLVCFEDTVPYLSQRFTRQGADFLVNVTNDGWFSRSAAPVLHLQASVFRSVEQRRALVRAANTGVSAVITPAGRISTIISGHDGKKMMVEGSFTAEVPLESADTFYRRHRRQGVAGLIAVTALLLIAATRQKRGPLNQRNK